MGGTLECESQPGQGSTFFFSIELERSPQKEKKKRLANTVDLEGCRVLIIDDNATNRDILVRQTASWGMHSHSAGGGEEGIGLLTDAQRQGEPFDVGSVPGAVLVPGEDHAEVVGVFDDCQVNR